MQDCRIAGLVSPPVAEGTLVYGPRLTCSICAALVMAFVLFHFEVGTSRQFSAETVGTCLPTLSEVSKVQSISE